MLALLGRTDVPVAAGAAAPLLRPLEIADDVHGESGLDGADLPEPRSELRPEGALAFLRATLEAAPEPGHADPDRAADEHRPAAPRRAGPRARRSPTSASWAAPCGEGNWTPAAEFNIWVDPEAARIVFRSGLPITMVGLDVTHTGALPATRRSTGSTRSGTPVARVFADLLRFYARFHHERYGWDGSPIHDAVAVAHVAVPGPRQRPQPYRVDVETTGEITRGRTVVDSRGVPGPAPNADVALGIDRARVRRPARRRDRLLRVTDAGPVLRYVAIGDSYTIGTSVAANESWPAQLMARLSAAPPRSTLALVANHAVNGASADSVARNQLPLVAAERQLGFASLLVGANDVVQGVPEAVYRADATIILNALLGRLAPDRILCVETPDYTVTPMGAAFGDPVTRRAAIVRCNAVLGELCRDRGIRFVDGILAISSEAALDPELVASDGLHPSGAQYARWVTERIEPVVRELLGRA